MADYCTAAEVAAHLNKTFTAAQTTEANAIIPAATAWINDRSGHSWPQSTAVTELHLSEGPFVYLKYTPVTSITSVKVRSTYPGAALTTLTASSDYELLDTTIGLLRLVSSYLGQLIQVIYTPAVATDARITLAAKKLVAYWMRPILDGVTSGIKRYSVGQELTVEYADGRAAGVPDDVVALVDSVSRVLVFA